MYRRITQTESWSVAFLAITLASVATADDITLRPVLAGGERESLVGLPFRVFSQQGDDVTPSVQIVDRAAALDNNRRFVVDSQGLIRLRLELGRMYRVSLRPTEWRAESPIAKRLAAITTPPDFPIVVGAGMANEVALPIVERRTAPAGQPVLIKPRNTRPVDDVVCEFPVQWCLADRVCTLGANDVICRIEPLDPVAAEETSFCRGGESVSLRRSTCYRVTPFLGASSDAAGRRRIYGIGRVVTIRTPSEAERVPTAYRQYLPGFVGRDLAERSLGELTAELVDVHRMYRSSEPRVEQIIRSTDEVLEELRVMRSENFANPRDLARPPVDLVLFRSSRGSGPSSTWRAITEFVQETPPSHTTIWVIADSGAKASELENHKACWPANFKDVISLQDQRLPSSRARAFGLLGRIQVDDALEAGNLAGWLDSWMSGGAAGVWLEFSAKTDEQSLKMIVDKVRALNRTVFACVDKLEQHRRSLYRQFDFVTTRHSFGTEATRPAIPKDKAPFDDIYNTRAWCLSMSDKTVGIGEHDWCQLPEYWSWIVESAESHNARHREYYLAYHKTRPVAVDIFVPAYFQDDFDQAFQQIYLDAARRQATIWIVFNPLDGPGNDLDPRYPSKLNDARRLGIKSLGYIAVSKDKVNGRWKLRDIDELKSFVDQWIKLYGNGNPSPVLDGFFFDNAPSDDADIETLRSLRTYAQQRIPGCRVVANPGRSISRKMAVSGIADAFIIHEGVCPPDPARAGPLPLPIWVSDHPERAGVLLHTAPDQVNVATTFEALLQDQDVRFVYLADQMPDKGEWTKMSAAWGPLFDWVVARNKRE